MEWLTDALVRCSDWPMHWSDVVTDQCVVTDRCIGQMQWLTNALVRCSDWPMQWLTDALVRCSDWPMQWSDAVTDRCIGSSRSNERSRSDIHSGTRRPGWRSRTDTASTLSRTRPCRHSACPSRLARSQVDMSNGSCRARSHSVPLADTHLPAPSTRLYLHHRPHTDHVHN